MKRPGFWAFVIAILSTAAARLLAHFALGDVPHVMDEIAYVFQAKTLLTGHVTAPVALPRAAFALWFVDDRASKYGIFPPGWPAVLSLGVGLHLRAWVNPVVHGITTWVVASAAYKLGEQRAKLLAALLYGFSPQALFLAASLMSHTVVAFGAACALSAGISAVTGKTSRFSIFWGGIGVAIALVTRPLCGVVVALGLISLLVVAVRQKKIGGASFVIAAFPVLAGVAILGAYNQAITGSATRFPQSVWFDEHAAPMDDPFFRYRPGCNDLGFGEDHGCDDGIKNAAHSLPNALSNTGDNLTAWLFLAGGGPLSLLAPVFVLYLAKSEERKNLLPIAVPIPAAIGLYALYWYAGTCYGARFYQAALPSLLLLGALAISRLDQLRPRATRWGILAWIALSLPGFKVGLDEISDRYWGVDDRFARVKQNWNKGPAVVMVAFKTDGLPMHTLHVTGFTSKSPRSVWHNSVRVLGALSLNSLDMSILNDELVFAKFHPALVSEIRARFPNHALYIYVMADSQDDDEIELYRASQWTDSSLPMPKDNFDGYVVP